MHPRIFDKWAGGSVWTSGPWQLRAADHPNQAPAWGGTGGRGVATQQHEATAKALLHPQPSYKSAG